MTPENPQIAPPWHHESHVTAAGVRWRLRFAELSTAPAGVPQSRAADAGNADRGAPHDARRSGILLIPGTGGTLTAWGGVVRALAEACATAPAGPRTVLAIDLPGHAGSSIERGDAEHDASNRDARRPNAGAPPSFAATNRERVLTMSGMAAAIGEMLAEIGFAPQLTVGHSAGAAVALRAAIDGTLDSASILGVNPAIVPPDPGVQWVSELIRPIVDSSLVASLAARFGAHGGTVDRLLDSTGSTISEQRRRIYHQLAARPSHVRAALGMMAHWDLATLVRDLPRVSVPVRFLAGHGDRWIRADAIERVSATIPGAATRVIDGGHLLPEEHPAAVAAEILATWRS